jgi:Flp pilus assembly protein TadD
MVLAWIELAKTEAARQDPEAELLAYEGASRADPANPELLMRRATILERLGRRDEARELRRRVARLR